MFFTYVFYVNLNLPEIVDIALPAEGVFRLCANTDPQRDSIFTKGPSDVLDHAPSEISIGSKVGIDTTKKLPGEGFKLPWPLLHPRPHPTVRRQAAVYAGFAVSNAASGDSITA